MWTCVSLLSTRDTVSYVRLIIHVENARCTESELKESCKNHEGNNVRGAEPVNNIQKSCFPAAVGVHQDGSHQSSGEDPRSQVSEVSVGALS